MKKKIIIFLIVFKSLILCSCNNIDSQTFIISEEKNTNLIESLDATEYCIFPNKTCEYKNIVQSSYQRYFNIDWNGKSESGYAIYLEIEYTDKQLEMEISRLENYYIPYHHKVFLRDKESKFFKLDTFVQEYSFNDQYNKLIYSSIDYNKNRIYYISIFKLTISEISFDYDILPIDFIQKTQYGDKYTYRLNRAVSFDNWPSL